MAIPGYKRLVPWLLARGNRPYERWIAGRKRALFSALRGVVVEIGPGAGANLPYLGSDVHWIGVEPNPYARPYLERAAVEVGVPHEVREGNAERLPVDAASADAVIGTLVLCSVKDLGAALREIQRVLKPGGRYIFIEHVAAPLGTWRRRLQRLVRAPWCIVADGCRPDRETLQAIRAAGFARVEAEEFLAPAGLVAPHIAGIAVKEGASA
jgi:ubiquinone/menaquinone biosynthesis C-methylase UbiE